MTMTKRELHHAANAIEARLEEARTANEKELRALYALPADLAREPCKRCRATGNWGGPVVHLGVPGLCMKCDGTGRQLTRKANQIKKDIEARRELARLRFCWKATRDAIAELEALGAPERYAERLRRSLASFELMGKQAAETAAERARIAGTA